MHYLAALMDAAGYSVAVMEPCAYNPSLPIVKKCEPDDIAVYPDATPGNPLDASRIVRYFLYYASAFFGGTTIPESECVIVYSETYFEDVAKHCAKKITRDDIICIPNLEAEWCFPGEKTIENVLYKGKMTCKEMPLKHCVVLPDASDPSASRESTMAILRKAKNFYTMDHYTIMGVEAYLCGCNVFNVINKDTFERVDILDAELYVMCPARDMFYAEQFAKKALRFFNL